MYRLAHLSDPHVPPDRRPRRRELLSKRVLGWLHWRRHRHRIHRREVLDRLTADLAETGADHVAVTGDLTIVSARAEWEACRAWLSTLGGGADVSIVPGNHDAYTRRAVPGTANAWRDYMAGDIATMDVDAAAFPYVRRRGPLAIVGCSSAVATAPFLATGRLGRRQLVRLEELLETLAREDRFRVVMIHHPPLREAGDRYRRLTDARGFAAVLAKAGAELIIHGHDHVASVRWLRGPNQDVPVVGVPSASALAHGGKPAAQYNIYEIGGSPGEWTCTVTVRGFDGEDIGVLDRRVLWQSGIVAAAPTIDR